MRSLFLKVYSNPAELIERAATERRFWWRVYLSGAAPSLAVLAMLAVVAAASGRAGLVVAYALLPLAVLMGGVGVAVTTTQHAQLWVLHLFGPTSLLAALLSGAGLLWPGGWLLSGALITPTLLGVLLSCACAVDVANQTAHLLREQLRQRQVEHPVDLATPAYQNRARTLRLVAAAGAVLLAALAQLLFVPTNPILGAVVGLALLAFAGACLRVEATLRCWFGGGLVAPDDRGGWHATYAGRWALFVPHGALKALLTSGAPPLTIGEVLGTLLRAGSLGPAVRRVAARLVADQPARLALALSLQPGAASALRYLAPAWPEPTRHLVLWFAGLAEEAARPTDLQRWIDALAVQQGSWSDSSSEPLPTLAQALATAGAALRCYTYDPIIEEAAHRLRQVMPALYGDGEALLTHGARWPDALLERVVAQGRLLRQR